MGILSSLSGAKDAKRGARNVAREQNKAITKAQEILNPAYDASAGYIQAGYDTGLAPIVDWEAGSKALWDPYLQLDSASIDQLLSMTDPARAGEYQARDPGYQWRLQQGLEATQNAAVARRMGMSGNTLAALNNYAQGAASQEFNNSYNRYLQGAQLGYRGRAASADSSRLGAFTRSQMAQNLQAQLGQNAFNKASSNAGFELQRGNVNAAREAAQAQASQQQAAFNMGLINSGLNLLGSAATGGFGLASGGSSFNSGGALSSLGSGTGSTAGYGAMNYTNPGGTFGSYLGY